MASINLWRVEGAGGVRVYRNGALVADLTPSIPNITGIVFNIGDSYSFEAYPSLGWNFTKFCGDAACTITTTQNPLTGYVSQDSGNVYVYFSPQSATITVSVAQGNGTVKVFKNGILLGQTKTTQAFNFVTGDNAQFQAIPDTGFSFQKFCGDTACSTTTTTNPFNVAIEKSGSVIAYFASTTPPPPPPPSTTYIYKDCKCQVAPSGTTGQYTESTCGGKPLCNLTSNMCLSGQCIPTLYVYAGVAFVGLILLSSFMKK